MYNNFLWGYLLLAQNLSSFISLSWKLDNPYYHNGFWFGQKSLSKHDMTWEISTQSFFFVESWPPITSHMSIRIKAICPLCGQKMTIHSSYTIRQWNSTKKGKKNPQRVRIIFLFEFPCVHEIFRFIYFLTNNHIFLVKMHAGTCFTLISDNQGLGKSNPKKISGSANLFSGL